MLQGLRTTVYPTTDLDASKAWLTALLGHPPYFDAPSYVGFDVGGYELGLMPAGETATEPMVYWGVPDADAALAALLAAGATEQEPVTDVGGDIRLGAVHIPGGSVLGFIENPHFAPR